MHAHSSAGNGARSEPSSKKLSAAVERTEERSVGAGGATGTLTADDVDALALRMAVEARELLGLPIPESIRTEDDESDAESGRAPERPSDAPRGVAPTTTTTPRRRWDGPMAWTPRVLPRPPTPLEFLRLVSRGVPVLIRGCLGGATGREVGAAGDDDDDDDEDRDAAETTTTTWLTNKWRDTDELVRRMGQRKLHVALTPDGRADDVVALQAPARSRRRRSLTQVGRDAATRAASAGGAVVGASDSVEGSGDEDGCALDGEDQVATEVFALPFEHQMTFGELVDLLDARRRRRRKRRAPTGAGGRAGRAHVDADEDEDEDEVAVAYLQSQNSNLDDAGATYGDLSPLLDDVREAIRRCSTPPPPPPPRRRPRHVGDDDDDADGRSDGGEQDVGDGKVGGEGRTDLAWASEALGKRPEATNLWVGDEASRSSMHRDHYENLFHVVRGTKTFTLHPPTEAHFLCEGKPYPVYQWVRGRRPGTSPPRSSASSSSEPTADVGDDASRSPHVGDPGVPLRSELVLRAVQPRGETPWVPVDPTMATDSGRNARHARYARGLPALRVEVREGQTLFLPAGWYHHVAQRGDARPLRPTPRSSDGRADAEGDEEEEANEASSDPTSGARRGQPARGDGGGARRGGRRRAVPARGASGEGGGGGGGGGVCMCVNWWYESEAAFGDRWAMLGFVSDVGRSVERAPGSTGGEGRQVKTLTQVD